MRRAFRYRIYPLNGAEKRMNEILELCCDFWNAAVIHRDDCYYRLRWGRLSRSQKRAVVKDDRVFLTGPIIRRPEPEWITPNKSKAKKYPPQKVTPCSLRTEPRPIIEPSRKRSDRKRTETTTFEALRKAEQDAEITLLKQEFPEYAIGGFSQALKNILDRIDKGYKTFFGLLKKGHHKARPPKTKKYEEYNSVTYPNQTGWKLSTYITRDGERRETDDLLLTLDNIGEFRVRTAGNRPIGGDIKTVTIKRESDGKWFVSFSCDNVKAEVLASTSKTVGLDVGVSHFLTTSDGIAVENPRWFKQDQDRILNLQRHWSRQKEVSKKTKVVSKGMQKTKKEMGRLYARSTRRRLDFICKLVHWLLEHYDTIYIEDLEPLNMLTTKKRKGRWEKALKRSIQDVAWSTFFSRLESGAEAMGKTVQRVRPEYTSKTCSKCGHIQPMPLHVRVFLCEKCNSVFSRDLNAARNIQKRGEVALGGELPVVDEDLPRILTFVGGQLVLGDRVCSAA